MTWKLLEDEAPPDAFTEYLVKDDDGDLFLATWCPDCEEFTSWNSWIRPIWDDDGDMIDLEEVPSDEPGVVLSPVWWMAIPETPPRPGDVTLN